MKSLVIEEIVDNEDGSATIYFDSDPAEMEELVLALVKKNKDLQKKIFSDFLYDALVRAAEETLGEKLEDEKTT